MYKCYSDAMGNMPCDYGVLCDRCLYMDVQQIDRAETEEGTEEEEDAEIVTAE